MCPLKEQWLIQKYSKDSNSTKRNKMCWKKRYILLLLDLMTSVTWVANPSLLIMFFFSIEGVHAVGKTYLYLTLC